MLIGLYFLLLLSCLIGVIFNKTTKKKKINKRTKEITKEGRVCQPSQLAEEIMTLQVFFLCTIRFYIVEG